MTMDMDMPPPPDASKADIPMIQRSAGGAPSDIRYSDFLKLVNANQIEKVTFSADGTKLLGVDVEGARLQIESLPSDPDLLTQLTTHKVDVTVLPAQDASGLGDLAQSLILPAVLFAGLFFLSRRGGGIGMGGGGPGNPMGFGKSKAE
jgi:cell division protease FtsH